MSKIITDEKNHFAKGDAVAEEEELQLFVTEEEESFLTDSPIDGEKLNACYACQLMNNVNFSKVCSKENNDVDKGEDIKSMINRSKFTEENSIALDASLFDDSENVRDTLFMNTQDKFIKEKEIATASKIIAKEIFANNCANDNYANNNDDKALEDSITIIANFEDDNDIDDDDNNINTDMFYKQKVDLNISHSITESHPRQNLGSECTTDLLEVSLSDILDLTKSTYSINSRFRNR